jgi:hypothetical protein
MAIPTDLIPDAERLSHVFSQAAAPAFFLGAVAGLLSILMNRLADVMGRLRTGDPTHPGAARADLLLRARLLHSAIALTLAGGICTTVLLAVAFMGAFAQLQHIYGAGMLFLFATVLIGGALFRFFQEVRVGLRELAGYTDAGAADTDPATHSVTAASPRQQA